MTKLHIWIRCVGCLVLLATFTTWASQTAGAETVSPNGEQGQLRSDWVGMAAMAPVLPGSYNQLLPGLEPVPGYPLSDNASGFPPGFPPSGPQTQFPVQFGPEVASPSEDASEPDPSEEVREIHRVTLITGDVVTVSILANGQCIPSIAPSDPGKLGQGFLTFQQNGDTYVVPNDVDLQKMDVELFNVDYLISEGYDKEPTLPVLVSYPSSLSVKAAQAFETRVGAVGQATVPLQGVNAMVTHVPYANVAAAYRSLAAEPQVRKIWLDKKVHVHLDDSVPLIEAPSFWAAGYRGQGTKIAILDTGIDATHPALDDLDDNPTTNDPKVLVNMNFTDDPDATDGFGHGTHCAGIAAGTAASSSYTGVAPGAWLWNVKVLDHYGSGYDDWIINGINYASLGPDGIARTGDEADVISMSLGGGVTDGTDPLSQAINLAVDRGVTVVVAAGNSGPDASTVSAPGVAEKAITVGATDKSDVLASFSSRGPTIDMRAKPDLVAPGVDIISAKLGGGYVSKSGTSMATPHVAGAAALLRQYYGHTATPQFIKDMLTESTSDLGYSVYDQGSGRLDLGQATWPKVEVSPANLSLGALTIGTAASGNVSFFSTDDLPHQVSLTADLKNAATGDNCSAFVSLSPATFTVPASGNVTVSLTVDLTSLPISTYSGKIFASVDSTAGIHAIFGFGKMREITVHKTNINGSPAQGDPVWLLMASPQRRVLYYASTNSAGDVSFYAPGGVYSLLSPNWGASATMPIWTVAENVAASGDANVSLDERDTKIVDFNPNKPGLTPAVKRSSLIYRTDSVAYTWSSAWQYPQNYQVRVSPFSDLDAGFAYCAFPQADFVSSNPGLVNTSEWTDLLYSLDTISADTTFVADYANLLHRSSTYAVALTGEKAVWSQAVADNISVSSWPGFSFEMDAPQTRWEWLSPYPANYLTDYQRASTDGANAWDFSGWWAGSASYASTYSMGSQPFSSGIYTYIDWSAQPPRLYIYGPISIDVAGNLYRNMDAATAGHLKVTQKGTGVVLLDTDIADSFGTSVGFTGSANFTIEVTGQTPLPLSSSSYYRLDFSTSQTENYWPMRTFFRVPGINWSGGVAGGDIPVRVDAWGPTPITSVQLRYRLGASGDWTDAGPPSVQGSEFYFDLGQLQDTIVSLDVRVADAAGNSMQRTTNNAFTVGPPGPPPPVQTDWVRQFGTAGPEYVHGVAADNQGNSYVAGYIDGVLPGQTLSGGMGAFIRKYDGAGNQVWTRQFGRYAHANGVATDASGNVVVVGYGDALSDQTAYGAFVRKYDSAGNELWTRQFDADSGAAYALGVAADASGNISVSGDVWGVLTGQTSLGNYDTFVRKYDSAGNELWTRQFGSTALDISCGVASDGQGNVFVSGYTQGALPGQSGSGGNYDAFVRKYNGLGVELWTRQFGSSSDDFAYDLAPDPAGGIVVSGYTYGTLPGQTGSGNADGFVRRYDGSGNESWTRQFGTGSDDRAFGVATAGQGDIYVAGMTYGALSGQTNAGGTDAFVRMYSSAGAEIWTRQFGSSAGESSYGVAANTQGDVFIGGYTYGTLAGQIYTGSVDGFIRKYSSTGTEAWTRQFSGNGNDYAYAVAANAGAVYVAGYVPGALPGQTGSGQGDAFLRKYDTSGNEQWTRQFGSGCAYAVAADGQGSILVAGSADQLPGQTTAGAFVRKYDSAGNELWTRQFSTTGGDRALATAVDAVGSVVVAGYAYGVLPGQTSPGSADAFVRKYDSSGNEVWTRQFGSGNDEVAYAVVTDAQGSIFVSGYTWGAFPGQTSSGSVDAFVRKYDSSGNEVWTRQFGSGNDDRAFGVAADGQGDVVVCGDTYGTLPGQSSSGASDAFVRKYSSSGVELWTRQFGSDDSDYARSVATDQQGNAVVAGTTWGYLAGQAYQGNGDVLLRKYDGAGSQVWTYDLGTSATDEGRGLAMDSAGNIFVAGSTSGALETPHGAYDAFVAKLAQTGPGWSMPMSVTTPSEGSNNNLELGANPAATDGYDTGIDVPHSPPAPGTSADSYFLISDSLFPQLDKDYRAPGPAQWTVHAQSNSQSITLSWDVSGIPSALFAYMNTGTSTVNMKAQNSIIVPAGSYNLTITVSNQVQVQIPVKAGWNMVSVPVVPQDTSVAAVFPGNQAVYWWNPATKSYVSVTSVEPQKGYWVAMLADTTFTVVGVPVYTWTSSMTAGWNMIGSVYGSVIDFVHPNTDPAQSIEGFTYWWDPETKSYVFGVTIEPGKGYWVAATADCTLTLTGP